jgi:hypothetical protein
MVGAGKLSLPPTGGLFGAPATQIRLVEAKLPPQANIEAPTSLPAQAYQDHLGSKSMAIPLSFDPLCGSRGAF